MHREIHHGDRAFAPQSNAALYFLTGLVGILICLDLWPPFAAWLARSGMPLPTWPTDYFGYRLALFAAIIGGARVLFGSLESLLEGRLGADLALAIACIAAILIGEPLVAAEVVFIGMLGECLESFTFNRTQRALRGLQEMWPRRCWVLRDGNEVRIATEDLQVGDLVVVKPGGRIPVDGEVREGRSTVDESSLTGESVPVDKEAGSQVYAGTLNQFGALTIHASKVADETLLGHIVALTAKALQDKPTIERTADRLARYFLPAVLGLAALTFLVALAGRWLTLSAEAGRLRWVDIARAVYPALSVLVVTCPCPLILATPAAVIAALGRLAGTGVLVKGGAALERLAGVTAFAFDKTGTLTEGRLELAEIIGLEGASDQEALALAAQAEMPSEHLLARVVVEAARQRGLALEPPSQFEALPGAGVDAVVAGQRVLVGNRRLFEKAHIPLSIEASEHLDRLDAAGCTSMLVASDGILRGILAARDRLRPDAAGALAELRQLGIRSIALLTGDRGGAARSVAAQLDLNDVQAELLPQDKAAYLDRLRAHERVAFVGDGINDAPALARADVGIALAQASSDLAAEAGDLVLLRDALGTLPFLVRLARETVRIIRQNIVVFAFGVNGVGILLTAWLWPLLAPAAWYEQGPLAAVIYHQIGSLAVLLNSMRLLWFERSCANPTLTRARQVMTSLDQWMDQFLDLHQLSHILARRWRGLAALGLTFVLLVWGMSGFIQVQPGEVAVLTRFGRPTETARPGLTWNWPWPVGQSVRLREGQINTLEIGYRSGGVPALAASSGGTWSSAHVGEGVRVLSDEAVFVTGDGNLIEAMATLRYAIDQPQNYLYQSSDVEGVLRAVAESVLRELTAASSFSDLLSTGRASFEKEALQRIVQRCQSYGGLGIRVEGLSIHDLHPPPEVVPAYQDVARAMEARDRQVNEARADALRRERSAQAEAAGIERLAQASYQETVLGAQSEKSAFVARQRARDGLDHPMQAWLLARAFAALWQGKNPKAVFSEYEQARQDQVNRQAAITDFRLFWDALTLALAGREKVLVDADKISGRRNLLLFDPDLFRPPMLPAVVPERSRSSNRAEKPPENP